MSKLVGTSVKRVEDPRFIQGRGRYVANLKLPGMVFVAIKRSPYAHAKITKIDAGEALKMEGVIAVYSGQDLVDSGVGSLPCGFNPPDIKTAPHMPLAADKVRHVGDGVAAVVAESPYIASDALDLIHVEYEPLPARRRQRRVRPKCMTKFRTMSASTGRSTRIAPRSTPFWTAPIML